MVEDHYYVLGIPKNASEEQIKQAYRILVLKYHPDKNDDPEAPELFDKITKAYNFALSNLKPEAPAFKSTAPKKSTLQGTNNIISITVTMKELIKGDVKTLITKRKGLCPDCGGTGSASKRVQKCTYCDGTGLQGLALVLGQKKKCTFCSGRAHLPVGEPCQKCKGTALILEVIKHNIKLNPYSKFINLPELGNFPNYGIGKAGSLIIELNVIQDPLYKVQGLNIESEIAISPAQAVLGDVIVLSVFDKEVALKIPSGTRHGDIIVLEQQGILYEGKAGSFKANIKLLIPHILSSKEKELYQELLNAEKTQPDFETLSL